MKKRKGFGSDNARIIYKISICILNLFLKFSKTQCPSESERLERNTRAELKEMEAESENNENIAERILRVSSRHNGLELNVILRDSALETILFE